MKITIVWRTVPSSYKPAVESFLRGGGRCRRESKA
jgi:hypothetical protein